MMLKMNLLLMRTSVGDKMGEVLSPTSLVFVGIIIIALLLGMTPGVTGSYVPTIVIGASILVTTLLLRQDEWAVIFILVLHLYVDWYLGTRVIALALTCILLVIFFLERCV